MAHLKKALERGKDVSCKVDVHFSFKIVEFLLSSKSMFSHSISLFHFVNTFTHNRKFNQT